MKTNSTYSNRKSTIPAEQEIRFWMRAPAMTINLAEDLGTALACMREQGIRRLPVVVDTGELCGIITLGDIRGAELLCLDGLDPADVAKSLRRIKVYEIMTKNPIAVMPETSLRETANLMIEHKIGGLPVVDEQDFVIGIITSSDLFEALIHQLDRLNGSAIEVSL
jgi:acetoin utilization protein AcuB/CBS domain-containing protein